LVTKSFKYLLRFGDQLADVNYFDSRVEAEIKRKEWPQRA